MIGKTLPNDPEVPLAAAIVSTQTAALLTMHNLSYVGNYQLKTKSGGAIAVMQFSMDSSTSTPFQLDSTVGGKTLRTTSSELTVSGNVMFYATEIKGIALGALPQDYTPDNPPPVVPTEMWFTDVTIGLALVTCDTLKADDLHIGS